MKMRKINYIFIVLLLSVIVFLLSAASIFAVSYIPMAFCSIGKQGTVTSILNGASAFGMAIANMGFTAIADWYGWIAMIIFWIVSMFLTMILNFCHVSTWRKFKNLN